MLNHITVMGRLTRDPELRHTTAGTAVASFSIACDRDFKDKATGERATDFIDIVAWRSTGEFASKYLTKGRMAVISGRLQIRDWKDKEGNKRRSAEVVAENIYFGDSKGKDSQEPPASSGGPVEAAGGSDFGLPSGFAPDFSGMTGEPDDGDLPF